MRRGEDGWSEVGEKNESVLLTCSTDGGDFPEGEITETRRAKTRRNDDGQFLERTRRMNGATNLFFNFSIRRSRASIYISTGAFTTPPGPRRTPDLVLKESKRRGKISSKWPAGRPKSSTFRRFSEIFSELTQI